MRICALLLVCTTAQAQIEDEPSPSPPPLVPDVVLRAVGDRPVRLRRRDRSETVGRILAIDGNTVVVAGTTVVAVPRPEIVEVALVEDAPALQAAARPRHIAVAASLAPGMHFDVDYKLFYSFFNFDFVMPAVYAGKFIAFAGGAGVNFPLGKRSGWKMEAFAVAAPLEFNRDWWVGLGVGLGFHYTGRSGFTAGFKVPLVGYTLTTDPFTQPVQRFAYFYLAAAAGMPMISVGYRF